MVMPWLLKVVPNRTLALTLSLVKPNRF